MRNTIKSLIKYGLLMAAAVAIAPALQAQGLPTNVEDMPVYRFRIVTQTGGGDDSATNGPIFVNIGRSKDDGRMLRMYLDKGGKEFDRGEWNSFEFFSNGAVKQMRDFKYFRMGLSESSNDGWCLKVIKIYVNGSADPIYRKEWDGCKWIKGSKRFTLNADELRRDNHRWITPNTNRAELNQGKVIISRVEWRTILATTMGDTIIRSDNAEIRHLKWGAKDGDYYTGVWRWGDTSSKLGVSFDLVSPLPWPLPDVEIDIRHAIKITCSSGKIRTKIMHYKLESSAGWVFDLIDMNINRAISLIIDVIFNDAFLDLSVRLPGTCKSVSITNNGKTTIKFE